MIDNSNSNESSPLVTVYMPTYNRVELLQRAVESVLNQDYQNIELIVVDDRSPDTTVDYLAMVAKSDTRMKYFVNEENSGACVSRNKAIFAAKGEFVTGLDDDDYFLPNRISSFVSDWDNIADGCIALYSNSYLKTMNGRTVKSNKKKHCSHSDLIFANWIGNQIFTKTSSLQKIGGFDIGFPAWQDIDCWYRLLSVNKLKAYLSEEYSYVVDASHAHERITSGRVSLIFKAYDYFCSNHELTNNQKKIMMLQLAPYTSDVPEIVSVIKSIMYLPKVNNIKRSLLVYLKPRIKNFNK